MKNGLTNFLNLEVLNYYDLFQLRLSLKDKKFFFPYGIKGTI